MPIHNRGLVYLNLSYVLLVHFFVYRTGTNVLFCMTLSNTTYPTSMHRGQYRLVTCVQEYHSFVITRSLKDIINLNVPIVLGSQRHNFSAADLDPHHFGGSGYKAFLVKWIRIRPLCNLGLFG
jgi:hypothetical protein